MTVVEGDLEPRVRRLEEEQRLWFELAYHLRRGQDVQNDRFTRVEGDIATLKSDVDTLKSEMAEVKSELVELKGQVNRLEVSTARGFDRVDAQFESLRAYIADIVGRRDQGEPWPGALAYRSCHWQ